MPEEKGQWTRQFHKNNTANAPFSVTAQRKVQAPLMNLTAEFEYAEVEGLQLLELPYVGDDLSMVVLLPRAIDGLTGMEGLLKRPQPEGQRVPAQVQTHGAIQSRTDAGRDGHERGLFSQRGLFWYGRRAGSVHIGGRSQGVR